MRFDNAIPSSTPLPGPLVAYRANNYYSGNLIGAVYNPVPLLGLQLPSSGTFQIMVESSTSLEEMIWQTINFIGRNVPLLGNCSKVKLVFISRYWRNRGLPDDENMLDIDRYKWLRYAAKTITDYSYELDVQGLKDSWKEVEIEIHGYGRSQTTRFQLE